MADKVIQGVNLIYLMRLENETGNAWSIGYDTDSSTSESRSYDTEATKFGSVMSVGAYEGAHSLSALYANRQSAEDKVTTLRDKCIRAKNPARIVVWEINASDINETDTTTLTGHMSIDRVNSVDVTGGAEGSATVDIETQIDEGPVSGQVNVTDALKNMLVQVANELEFMQPTDNTGEL